MVHRIPNIKIVIITVDRNNVLMRKDLEEISLITPLVYARRMKEPTLLTVIVVTNRMSSEILL